MRVIAGSARRLLLKTPKGLETRPTSDQIKETLFNILMPYLYDANFLDLFSGSGGIGIEALSRGCKSAVFVENSKAALKCIEDNIKNTHFEELSTVYPMDVFSALNQLELKTVFDVVFMDPPRTGSDKKFMSSVIKLGPSRIVYISCGPETLARDLEYLTKYGYEVRKIQPVDMFSFTDHCENVCLLTKKFTK